LEPVAPGLLDERAERAVAAELGVDRVVPAVLRPDRVRPAGVAREGGERVVAALAVRRADGVDGRQVDDVEPHLRDGGQAAGRGGERARAPAPVLEPPGALGAWEHLVPRARERERALDA